LLDNLDVISTTIDANYEMSCYKDALNSSSPSYASKFVSKFPNSNYLQEVKQYLNSLDGKFINECNSKSCYKSYLEYFSNGKNREYALTRIKYYEDQEYQSELAKKQAAIAAEKQKQAEIAYQKEQARLAQIERDKKIAYQKEQERLAQEQKKQQEYENEKYRTQQIKDAQIGDMICYNQVFEHHEDAKSVFYITYKDAVNVEYTMTVKFYVENKVNDRLFLRVVLVTSSNKNYTGGLMFKGLDLYENTTIWLLPNDYILNPIWKVCN